jgi:hypothetical protein
MSPASAVGADDAVLHGEVMNVESRPRPRRSRRQPVAVAGAVLAMLAGAAPAGADTLTVNLHDASGGAALPGTAAAVADSGSSAGAATASGTGQAQITGLAAGTYTVTASLPGYAVTRVSGVASDGIVAVELTRSANQFVSVPVFGGANGGSYADGQPGVFYVQSTQIPQLYRTTDWGGSWAPVSVAFDDAAEGLPGGGNIGRDISVTTSGFPGEIAAFVTGSIYASRDFGVSWKKVAGPAFPVFPALNWGHAGGTSVLVSTSGDHQFVADMTTATPTFTQMTTDYARVANGEAFDIANGQDKPYVAVADTNGAVNVYELTPALAPGAVVAGPIAGFLTAGPSRIVAFGGKAPATGPPSGIAVSGNAGTGATVKAIGDAGYPVPSQHAQPCAGAQPGPTSAFTADTGTTAGEGMGTLNFCWLSLSGGVLTVSSSVGGVIDAGWGQSFGGNVSNVVFSYGDRGPLKSAALVSGKPAFDATVEASAGTGTTSGGASVNGITAPTVLGQTFGPAAPAQQATVLHGGFGGLGYASADGGQSVKIASGVGGSAVDWFSAASGSWLVFGTASKAGPGLLTAFKDWTPATPKAPQPNVIGAQNNDDSMLIASTPLASAPGHGDANTTALAGAPGTDLVFIGLSDGNGVTDNSHGAVRRVKLTDGSPGPSVSEVTAISAPDQIVYAIHDLAYCPAEGSANSVKDVLLVATGTIGIGGGLWRVTGATGASPAATLVGSAGSATVWDVKAHCASGTVWVGTNGIVRLGKSVDGGATFTSVTVPGTGPVQTIGLNPTNPAEVLIGIGVEGQIYRSVNTGATWATINNPSAGGHNFSGDGIADMLVPPDTTAARALRSGARFSPRAFSGLGATDVMIAGAGVYSASLRTTPVPAVVPPVVRPTVDTTRPAVGLFKVTYKTFAVANTFTALTAAKKKRPHKGTAFTFTLSEKASVSIVIRRGTKGYTKGKKCLAKKPKGKVKRCVRYVKRGTLVRKNLRDGKAKIAFSGRMGKKKLPTGSYQARLTAKDAAGNVSKPARVLTFKIVEK